MAGGPILVTGATGKQGGATVRHLLGRGFRVRALTRDINKPAARALAQLGVEVMQGDLNDRAMIDRAIWGCQGVFSVQQFWESGYQREIEQGKRLADAARDAGVGHLVYSSVASANKQTGLPHFESKWIVEQHIRSLGVPVTILRPVFFMQNWVDYQRDSILAGEIVQPMDPDVKLQQIAVEDIGLVAATAFANPAKWIGREIDLAGESCTMTETAGIFSRVLGRPVKYVQVPWEGFCKAAGEEMYQMYRWFNDVGYSVDIPALRQEFPDLTTLEQYVRREWMKS